LKFMRRDIKLILFYITYIITIIISDKMVPSGPCTPGLGFFLFLLLIPISIISFLRDLYKYYSDPIKWRLNCMAIHGLVWLILFVIIRLNIL